MLKLRCPSCGRSQQVPDEVKGLKVRCPACRTVFRAEPDATAAYDLAPMPAPTPAPPRPPAPPSASRRPRPAPEPARAASGGVAPWIYGVAGGAGVGVLVAIVVAIRSLGGPAASPFPDPSVDIALGVASQAGSPPPAAPVAPTTTVAVANAPTPVPVAPVVNNPPPIAPMVAAHPAPAPPAAAPTPPPASPTPAPAPGTPLTTAQIVAKWEPSIALVKGDGSSGTGFLVRPGIIATNSHVIDDDFITALEVRFPSAPEGKQGPFPAELLYEDPRRDLAFLKVATDLPAIDVAPSYAFVKGEDITVIGNPGLGGDVVLENAISRGVMSSKATLDGMNYLQLSIAVNPGNSGGPVFDSAGRVIGVVTLKSTRTEAMAFSIPVEELQSALATLGTPHPEHASRHRAQVSLKLLTAAGAIYGIGLEVRAILLRQAPPGRKANLLPNEGVQGLDRAIADFDDKVASTLDAELARMKSDAALTAGARGRYQDLAASYHSMKKLYGNTNRPADQYAAQVRDLRARYIRLVDTLRKDVQAEVPEPVLSLLKATVSASQPQAAMAQVMPTQGQSRILRGRSRIIQRPGAPSAAQSARQRMQDARQRMQDARDRMHGRGR